MDKKDLKLLITYVLIAIIICMLMYCFYFYKKAFEETNTELTSITERNTKMEEFYNRSMQNVKIEIVQDSLTASGAKIVITDSNEYQYLWRENYAIEKRENDVWKEIKPLNVANFSEDFYKLNENNQIEQNIDWVSTYGTLTNGTYRIVKHVYTSVSDIYFESEEFEIK